MPGRRCKSEGNGSFSPEIFLTTAMTVSFLLQLLFSSSLGRHQGRKATKLKPSFLRLDEARNLPTNFMSARNNDTNMITVKLPHACDVNERNERKIAREYWKSGLSEVKKKERNLCRQSRSFLWTLTLEEGIILVLLLFLCLTPGARAHWTMDRFEWKFWKEGNKKLQSHCGFFVIRERKIGRFANNEEGFESSLFPHAYLSWKFSLDFRVLLDDFFHKPHFSPDSGPFRAKNIIPRDYNDPNN